MPSKTATRGCRADEGGSWASLAAGASSFGAAASSREMVRLRSGVDADVRAALERRRACCWCEELAAVPCVGVVAVMAMAGLDGMDERRPDAMEEERRRGGTADAVGYGAGL